MKNAFSARGRLAVLLCALIPLFSLAGMTAAATHQVRMENNQFRPAVTNIAVGDTVVWVNINGSHTVTGTGADPFCGNNIVSSCTRTFNTAGSYPYRCLPHFAGGMTGLVIVAAAPNTPPAIAITNPANNTILAAPAAVTLGAAASDANGTVTNVLFLTNSVAVGNDTSAPYSFQLSSVASGTYVITARATDNQGAISTSAPVRLRVVQRPFITFLGSTESAMSLQYNTVTGVSYVVEGTSTLTNYSPVITNAGTGLPLSYSAPTNATARQFYRVRVQP